VVAGENRFPVTANALNQALSGPFDGFVVVIDPLLRGTEQLRYATYLGGPWLDAAVAVVADPVGRVYVPGTASHGFPTTPGAFSTRYNLGFGDAFVTCMNLDALLGPPGDR